MSTTLDYRSFFHENDGNGRQYWGSKGAGCIFIAKDTGHILLAHRSDEVDYEPHTWGTWGGKIDSGETPKDCIEREIEEETGFKDKYNISLLYVYRDGEFEYYNYLIIVPWEFTPQLNWENDNSKWVEFGNWPKPLHFGLEELIKHAGGKILRIINLLEKKKENLFESVDIPPAIIQHVNAPKTNIINSQQINDAYIVVTTLWGEARGEGEQGMQAVLNVIMNRTHNNFSKAKDVVLKPKQFSMWNNIHDPEKLAIKLRQEKKDDKSYLLAITLVDKAIKRDLPDITGGATYYFNPKKAHPSWADKLIKTKTIGNHDFYKEPNHHSLKEGLNDITISSRGNKKYEMSSQYSTVIYTYEPDTRTFYLQYIKTYDVNNRNKGYAKELLNSFFHLIKQYNGILNVDTYTGSGMNYIKPIVERLAKEYNIRVVDSFDKDDEEIYD